MPLDVDSDTRVSRTAFTWMLRGARFVTVLSKARFSIVPHGKATLVAPAPIDLDDRFFETDAGASLAVASDRVPYRPRCDVTLTGHAQGPEGALVERMVRLGVASGARPLLDKVLRVLGDRDAAGAPTAFHRMPLRYERAYGGPGTTNPVGTRTPNLVHATHPTEPVGFGPISPGWPARAAHLGASGSVRLLPDGLAVPEEAPWSFFQAAPHDQQIEHLQGGEWLVVDGIHPQWARIATVLPSLRPRASVWLGRDRAPQPVDLRCDGLAVDADAMTLTLSWRANVPISVDHSASDARFQVTVVDHGDASHAAPHPPAFPGRAAEGAHRLADDTVSLGARAGSAAALRPAMPFENRSPLWTAAATPEVAVDAESPPRVVIPDTTLPATSQAPGDLAPFPIALPEATDKGERNVQGLPWDGPLQQVEPAREGDGTLAASVPAPQPSAAAVDVSARLRELASDKDALKSFLSGLFPKEPRKP